MRQTRNSAPPAIRSPRINSYLNQYVGTVRPSLISYDHYQFIATSDGPTYLQNLAMVAEEAQAGRHAVHEYRPSLHVGHVVAGSQRQRVATARLHHGGLRGPRDFLFQLLDPTPQHRRASPAADGTPTSVYTALTPLNSEFVAIVKQVQPRRLDRDVYCGLCRQCLAAGDHATARQRPLPA